jgi:hypothetical protein
MVNWLREIRLLERLGEPSTLALVASFIATLAGFRMTRRVAQQEDSDLRRATQPLTALARGSFETLALTCLIVFSMVLLGLYCWSVMHDVHHVAPAVI